MQSFLRDRTVYHAPVGADGRPCGSPVSAPFCVNYSGGSVLPDQEYWGSPLALLKGITLVTSYVVVFTDTSSTLLGGTYLPHAVGGLTLPTAHMCQSSPW